MTLDELHCHFASFAPPDIQVLCDGSTMDHFGVLVQREWIACLADAIRERNALRQRIESAPVVQCQKVRVAEGHATQTAVLEYTHERIPGGANSWIGKRVRLVVENGE